MNEPLFCKDCKMHPAVEVQLEAICKKIEQNEKISNIKFEYLSQAKELAKDEMERRLEGMNEFRAQLEKQTQTFVSRVEFEGLREKLNILSNQYAVRTGSKIWETVILSSMVTAIIMALGYYLFKL